MQAKILQHDIGLGAPTPDLVRQRAHEIAIIEGHREVGREDWEAAKRELHGGHDFSDNGDADMAVSVSGRDMVAGSVGRHVPNMRDDTEHAVEELIAEGMDEAEHEQMLQARLAEDHDGED